MTDITELTQSHELLIANGQQTADLLRHLADNEIDSDYFAVVSECESYGKETDAELSITEFALRAAGYVDALVEALEKAQQRIAELSEGKVGSALLERENHHVEVVGKLTEHITELESEIEKWKQEAEAWEQVAEKQLATAIELESRTVKLVDCDFGAVQHMSGGSTDYCHGFVDGTQNAIRSITAAGIKVEAE
ncbi:ead/Ea22-like family protein [Klebsiella quasipneumoniae]|uniref:ead/Ea22-like family protein n=1 Tax=Klebsiella quasipneumoniae TaxID=1463165 RepID=UPI003EE472AD